MIVIIGMTVGLLLIVLVLFKDKIPFRFMCKLGLHKSPKIDELDCDSDFYKCKRCKKEIPH